MTKSTKIRNSEKFSSTFDAISNTLGLFSPFEFPAFCIGIGTSVHRMHCSTKVLRFGFSMAAAMRSLSFICLLTGKCNGNTIRKMEEQKEQQGKDLLSSSVECAPFLM